MYGPGLALTTAVNATDVHILMNDTEFKRIKMKTVCIVIELSETCRQVVV